MLVVARLDPSGAIDAPGSTTVDALAARDIGLRSLHENIDTTSATGRLILHIFAALGRFEVELLRERTEPHWQPVAPVGVSAVALRRWMPSS